MTVQMTMEEYVELSMARDKWNEVKGLVAQINNEKNYDKADILINDILVKVGVNYLIRSNYERHTY